MSNQTDHSAILIKKFERLAKHTGGKLRKKTAAYEAALARYNKSRKSILKVSETPAPKSTKSKPPVVESGTPEYNVTGKNLTPFKVKAPNEKAAREEARKALGVPRLPAGTVIEKIA